MIRSFFISQQLKLDYYLHYDENILNVLLKFSHLIGQLLKNYQHYLRMYFHNKNETIFLHIPLIGLRWIIFNFNGYFLLKIFHAKYYLLQLFTSLIN
jgi:hypothetical protein